MNIIDIVTENKIKLSSDPNNFGAVGLEKYNSSGLPVMNIPVKQLVGFEPEDKMSDPKSMAKVDQIATAVQDKKPMPPILARKFKNGYQVIDGHHRFWGQKKAGVGDIKAKIVPPQDIVENFADGKVKGKSRPGRVKKAGASCSGSVTSLRAKAKKHGGEKGKMYHWCANMKSGRKKA